MPTLRNTKQMLGKGVQKLIEAKNIIIDSMLKIDGMRTLSIKGGILKPQQLTSIFVDELAKPEDDFWNIFKVLKISNTEENVTFDTAEDEVLGQYAEKHLSVEDRLIKVSISRLSIDDTFGQ